MSEALTPREAQLLDRQLRRGRLPLWLSIGGVAAALGFGAFYAATHRLDAARGIILILLLVGAKNNLRIYRLSRILDKLCVDPAVVIPAKLLK